MAAVINTVYPSYNSVNNYSGVHSAINSAGAVRNTEHHDTIISLERTGRLNLSQFGIISLPREVLFLQDERGAKVKGTREGDKVASSTQTDFDEDRRLEKIRDAADNFRKVEAVQRRPQDQSDNVDAQEKTLPAVEVEAEPAQRPKPEPAATVVGNPTAIYATLQAVTSATPAPSDSSLASGQEAAPEQANLNILA